MSTSLKKVSFAQLDQEAWRRLNAASGDAVFQNVFFDPDFLFALSETGCIGSGGSWRENVFLAEEGGEYAGAIVAFDRSDSYGEYIFDWSWAEAAMRSGLPYYPKSLAAIPFTPAGGARILLRQGGDQDALAKELIRFHWEDVKKRGLSSAHYLFTGPQEQQWLNDEGFLSRFSIQFHWQNQGYQDFEAYLSALTSKRRKQIRKERRELAEAGLQIRIFTGEEIQAEHGEAMWKFYQDTGRRKWGSPYLNRGFFERIFRDFRRQMVVCLAFDNGQPVAGTLNFRSGDTLYGRYWGMDSRREDWHKHLHFECCYYKLTEYCIENGLKLFEAGAQGEHKHSRGFEATLIRSAHRFTSEDFHRVIGGFLERERRAVEAEIAEWMEHSAYRRNGDE